jgi:heterodisulfide reductase subunit B2
MELMKAQSVLAKSDDLRQKISEIVELPIRGDTRVLNLIQVVQQIGLETIKSKVVRPLVEFRPACYYGCLLTRPPETLRFDDCEHPDSMETILRAIGAEPVDWNHKTECCGAGMTMADEEVVLKLSHKVLSDARLHGANCMVVACPMCHVNLDMKQADIERRYDCRHDLTVYYLSDLVGLAVGLSEKDLGIDRHFVVKR